jgi:glycosyltransferase involved in cell wall biosynthesis
MKLDQLSVFFPAYNEEENVPLVVEKALEILPQVADEYEVIVVNDGSQDRTGEVAEELARAHPRVRVIHHERNQGYGAALRTGFRAARYPWVAFTDSDGQFDFADIERFLGYTQSADLILGYRLERADSALRRFYTVGWALIPRLLLGLDVKDYSCGFKLIKKSVIEAVEPLQGEEKVYQIELLVKAKRKGFRFAEVGVHHYPREFGQQTGADLGVVTRSMREMFYLYRRLGR